jgi:uncharacterized membrane protein (UPF0127 family)
MRHVQVVNLTRQAVLARQARIAGDPFSRLAGLLGSRTLASGSGLVLRPCTSIHMFGMRYAIDALYVDAHDCVIHAIADLRPWRLGPIEPRADYVIELPAGVIAASQTAPGDCIALEPTP